jgi:uncharacterized protein (DUF1697 family)
MPRYVAFLRGVSPQNAKMPELKRCFEKANFTNVKTVLSSGNVAFDTPSSSISAIERKIETSLLEHLGRTFYPIVRSVATLDKILRSDPYHGQPVPEGAKRVVSFLRKPLASSLVLPIEKDGAAILSILGTEVYSAYVPSPKGPVFMVLIQKAFGDEVTTRTWETVKKCAAS